MKTFFSDCGIPPDVLNGKRSFTETTYGSFTNYTCDAGFDQTGSRMVMCTADGSWDTLPVCSKIGWFELSWYSSTNEKKIDTFVLND